MKASYKNRTKIELNCMAIYIVSIYLPYMIKLFLDYDVFHISLSRIGWRCNGLPFLILYGILTIPFLVCELSFHLKFRKNKKDKLLLLLLGGCLSLGAAIALPFRETDSKLIQEMHNTLAMASSVLLIITVTCIIIRYCNKIKESKKGSCIKIALLYSWFLMIIIAGYLLVRTVAIFEVGLTFGFLVILYFLNKSITLEVHKSIDISRSITSNVFEESSMQSCVM